MRCYFIRNGHIVGFEEIIGLTDEEAILRGYPLFQARKHNIDAFEIWDGDRFVFTSRASGDAEPRASNRYPTRRWIITTGDDRDHTHVYEARVFYNQRGVHEQKRIVFDNEDGNGLWQARQHRGD